ncbi:enoyl-CoA hydratase/isomerase family protein [Candidatus Poriferisodalis sp.]|uniref:enoyl-CoA hydratase/isomerase family protein n=1 Tax=Candidatus Poriferisodalis sp. TaxID=3101277 RepID=UPI003B01E703
MSDDGAPDDETAAISNDRAQAAGNADGAASEAVLYELSGGVATITLNRPDYRNALSVEIVNGVGDCLEVALADAEARVILLTHVGNTFCAGADLRAARPGVSQPEQRHDFVAILERIMTCDKPVVGRLAGHATAGGVGLAAALDISIAADDAIIGFTEVRIGVAPAVISVVCLPKLRRADASELFLEGERVPAPRAAAAGLINRSVPRDELDDEVAETLRRLLRGGPEALANTKQLITKVPQMARAEAWVWTAELSQRLFGSAEATEGIAAFRERRDAGWVPPGQ